ncbi:TonB-dependent receptor plug domain-containing protein [Sphingomonas sediminicola]|uniref:TonB-dependent receptor plug domain-containing protein n=1 Tax=Sphingomonas sediminicola TaxID=386874 RepID=UPI001CA75BA8|nr:TonB-dependent receptor plug domain-containing protein [Sphingomonas sediminicola]
MALSTPAYAQAATATDVPVTTTAAEAQAPATAAQQAPATEEDIYGEEGDAIVVTGIRRGSVVGDIPPENVLGGRDVRATGATDINELLDALAPQIGSARGRGGERPILLLNGQRVSSFREMRDIPTEAIERVEILPEEVALKYGYRADQRVVNIVLRERFRSTVARLEGNTATEGGYLGGTGELTQLRIQRNGRTTFNVRAKPIRRLQKMRETSALRIHPLLTSDRQEPSSARSNSCAVPPRSTGQSGTTLVQR